jgi:transposase-like protein
MELSLTSLAKHFSDEGAAYQLVEAIRWPDGPVCPHCGTINHAYYIAPRHPRTTRIGNVSHRRLWKCGSCMKQFSVLVGTIFEDSKIPLSKWLLAVHLMCAGKNGIAANELRRTLEVSYKTAWFMCHRIRLAMTQEPLSGMLSGTVEADETYIGGKRKGTLRGRPGQDSHKSAVVTLVERGGEARSRAVQSVNSKNIREILSEQVAPTATLMTDEFRVYRGADSVVAAHETVEHSRGEYKRGHAHTNTVEGFFQPAKALTGWHVSSRVEAALTALSHRV